VVVRACVTRLAGNMPRQPAKAGAEFEHRQPPRLGFQPGEGQQLAGACHAPQMQLVQPGQCHDRQIAARVGVDQRLECLVEGRMMVARRIVGDLLTSAAQVACGGGVILLLT